MAIDSGMEIVLLAAYCIPILVLMAFVERMGKKYLIYLLWGFLASIPVYLLVSAIPPGLFPKPFVLINLSPVMEEFFKALPIIIPALIGIANRDEDVLVCAMASGIGFSVVENFYLINSTTFQAGTDPVMGVFLYVLARTFSTSLMHGCTCGIIGYGVVLIRNFDRKALPTLLFGFYTIAVTTHAIFNLLSIKYGEMGFVIDFIFPLVLFLFLHACYRVDVPVLFKKSSYT
jgi:RsiW-degrading membrane proteinase PrsW (M82 family)